MNVQQALEWLETVDRDDDDFEALDIIRAHVKRLQERMDVVLHAGPATKLAVSVFDRATALELRVKELEQALEDRDFEAMGEDL